MAGPLPTPRDLLLVGPSRHPRSSSPPTNARGLAQQELRSRCLTATPATASLVALGRLCRQTGATPHAAVVTVDADAVQMNRVKACPVVRVQGGGAHTRRQKWGRIHDGQSLQPCPQAHTPGVGSCAAPGMHRGGYPAGCFVCDRSLPCKIPTVMCKRQRMIISVSTSTCMRGTSWRCENIRQVGSRPLIAGHTSHTHTHHKQTPVSLWCWAHRPSCGPLGAGDSMPTSTACNILRVRFDSIVKETS